MARASNGRGRSNRGGREGRGGRGRAAARGSNYAGTTVKAKGLCSALGAHVFDYGQKGAADQMKVTYEKIVQHIGTVYGQDISNELQNRKKIVLEPPEYTQDIKDKHIERVARIAAQHTRLALARNNKRIALEALVEEGEDADADMDLAILMNEIEEADYMMTAPVPYKLTEEEKQIDSNNWKTHRERVARLEKQRGQAFSMIRGQCMQILLDKMKPNADWIPTSESYDPLLLINLIEKTVLAQTEDQYQFATIFEQLTTLVSFLQNSYTNDLWYEKFNTRVDVARAIGLSLQHKTLLNLVAAEKGKTFDTMTKEEQEKTIEDQEERLLTYMFLRLSGKQHGKLKMDLQDGFATGNDWYPKNRQEALHLLDKYTKSVVVAPAASEGTSFAQKGTKGDYDKDYWKDKECYNCNKKGHPSSSCPLKDKKKDKKKKKEKDDDSSTSSKSSKSSSSSITKLQKQAKQLKKTFTTLTEKIDELENEDSDLSDSDSAQTKASHFQMGFQFTQREPVALEQIFEKKNADIMFEKIGGTTVQLNLQNVILLDSQSTMDLFCNKRLVNHIYKSKRPMKLQSNGGTMLIKHKASITGYEGDVWYSKNAITNIIALSNLIKQYQVTYDSNDKMFVVHRQQQGKPDMEFRQHETGLHYYQPDEENFAFISTVDNNKLGYTKQQLKGAELAKQLYATLGYPSVKDFRWMVQSNQIKDCPVTVQDIESAHKIWGKDISALKGKTTRKKPSHVAADYVKVPSAILKLHKDVVLTADIFFVNKIPFCLTLSRKICFTAVNHLADRKVNTIMKAYKDIHYFYLNRGFRITTLHVDGEFAPLQAALQAMPDGPRVNLASSNEHVPEIERRIRVVKERA